MVELANQISRPELTLPLDEAEALRAAYVNAGVILEYGSGGSTAMAAEMPGKQVFSVESDRDWAQMMQDWFKTSPPAQGTNVDVIWADIGATKDWGHPVDDSGWKHYPDYSLAIWDLDEFQQPDVVLVDGRFRPGCVMATAIRTQKPVRVFVDDYKRRTRYHDVEKFLGTPRLTGRMAEFDVAPMAVPADHLLTIMKMMMQP